MIDAGDRTQAEALRIAEAYFIRMGWKFSAAKVGETARVILEALERKEAR